MPNRIKNLMSSDSNRNFIKFAALQSSFWMSVAIGNFFTVFLQENGYTVSNIGIVNACISALCIIAIPMWGMISDRIQSIKKVVLVLLSGSIAFFWLLPFTWEIKLGALPLAIVLGVVTFFFRNPGAALVDNWTVRGAVENKLNYGAVRSCGSLGFAIAGFTISYFIPAIGVNWSFFLSSVFMTVTVLIAIRTPDGARNVASQGEPRPKLSLLFKNYYYIAYLVFFAGFNLALTCNFVFLPFLVQSRGVPISSIGFVSGFGALVEMPMLVLSGFLRRRFPPYKLVIGAIVFFMMESLLLGFTTEFWQIIMVRSLFGLGNGLFIAGSANHIFALAPEGLKATAQTIVAAVGSIAGILGNAFGGFLIEAMGVGSFYTMIGLVMAGMTLIFIASFVFGNKVLKLEKPGLM